MKVLRDRVAVVTGAASGIGRALAERCLHEGMRVVLADIEADALEQTARELSTAGARVLSVVTDVARGPDVEALAQRTLSAFGAVHLVCNNAGVGFDRPLWETSVEDWEWVLGVNLWGVVHGIRVFVPILLAQKDEGHIVNTASIAGLIAGTGLGAYKASKHAVVSISETLAGELREHGAQVGVTVLCPGFVRTRITSSSRNRPGAASRTHGGVGAPMDAAIAAGSAPELVAEAALEAVRSKRLYVLTHPEWTEAVRKRMIGLLDTR